VSGIALQGDGFGLPGALEAAAGLWWVALVLSCATAFTVPLAMQTISTHTSDSVTAAWLLPIVPPITIAASGASISNLLIDKNPEYALKIWIASYIMNGIGCLLASMVLVLYFQRLILHHIPGREVVVSTFLPLGPCGQGGYALLQLVSSAHRRQLSDTILRTRILYRAESQEHCSQSSQPYMQTKRMD
jgi:tellurite resistance protein TehA-like permease